MQQAADAAGLLRTADRANTSASTARVVSNASATTSGSTSLVFPLRGATIAASALAAATTQAPCAVLHPCLLSTAAAATTSSGAAWAWASAKVDSTCRRLITSFSALAVSLLGEPRGEVGGVSTVSRVMRTPAAPMAAAQTAAWPAWRPQQFRRAS